MKLVAAFALLVPCLADSQTLVGFAELPADTFRDGPASGQFLAEDANLHGRTAPFESQPVQGISSMLPDTDPGNAGSFLALSDNGFGTKANSADYLLCVYRVTPHFRVADAPATQPAATQPSVSYLKGDGRVDVELAFHLSDPDKHVPWPIVADGETYPNSDIPVPAVIRDNRLLTGADFDVESFVRLPDGSFWVGDEFGPFLLHVDAKGKLLEPPVQLPGDGMHSPDHPTKDPDKAKIPRSGGIEGMSLVSIGSDAEGWSSSLFPLLEKPIDGGVHPMLLFFPEMIGTREPSWVDLTRHFPLEDGATAIGEAVATQTGHIPLPQLVIERDSAQGEAARVKTITVFWSGRAETRTGHEESQRIFDAHHEPGPVTQLIIDLLHLRDPHDLDRDGKTGVFRFPYWTIESLVVIDDRTLLVVNDNNYPLSDGRPEQPGPDTTQLILIRLDTPLSEIE